MSADQKYVAFLRGINVGGHHKVPMADLQLELKKLGLLNVVTLLNSGNIIFDSSIESMSELENTISGHLEKTFEFSIPTIIRSTEFIYELLDDNPFKDISITNDIRLYLSFLRNDTDVQLELPWKSSDSSFEILEVRDKTIISVLDVSVSQTPKAMGVLEKSYGKDITTRNWKTIERIGKKLS
jgi:uncharacterized protein (DUF1697 family)